MRYEYAIKNTTNKYELIEKEVVKVYHSIIKAYEKGELNRTECENILVLGKDILDEISKSTIINRKLVNIMGNEILLTAEERGIEKGAFNMALNNIKNAMEAFGLSFDDVCDKLQIQDKEKYRRFITG